MQKPRDTRESSRRRTYHNTMSPSQSGDGSTRNAPPRDERLTESQLLVQSDQ